MKKVLVVAVALMLIFSASAFAGANFTAKGAVHVEVHASRTCTKGYVTIDACVDIVFEISSPDADCFPVFYDLVEYQGFDYGLTWPGMYSCAFNSCSDLAIGTILWPGDGISHAWYVCQPGPVSVPGWGWIYDYGMVCLVPHPTAGGPNVGDCSGELDVPICYSCAGIGGYVGDDPCRPTGTEQSTWGNIKSMFE